MTSNGTGEDQRRYARVPRDSHGFSSDSGNESDDGQNINGSMHTPLTISSSSGESYEPSKYLDDEDGWLSPISSLSEHDDVEANNHEEPDPRPQEQLAAAKCENEKNTAEISALKKTVDRLARMVEVLTEKSNNTEDLNSRIAKVEERVEKRVDNLSEKVRGIERGFGYLSEMAENSKQDFDRLSGKVEGLEMVVDGLKDDVKRVEDYEESGRCYVAAVEEEVWKVMEKTDNLHPMQESIKKLEDRLWEVSDQARFAKEEAVRAGMEARRLVDDDLRLEREENRGLKRKLEQMEGAVERETMRREFAEARANNLAKDLQLAASSSLHRLPQE